MVRAVRWSVVAVMLAAGVLAGCDSSPGDPVTPTPSPSVSSSSASPSASPSPSVTASGPQIPAAAREKTDAGAEAFVKFYIEELNRALTTPSSKSLEQLSVSSCRFCQRNIDNVSSLISKQRRYGSAPIAIRGLSDAPGAPTGQVFFNVTIVQLGSPVVASDGTEVDRDQKGEGRSLVGVVWRDEGWKMLDVEVA